MLKNRFVKLSEDNDFYENEFLNYYDGDENKAEQYFEYYLELFLERLNRITTTPYGIVEWRVIKATSLETINLQNIGGSWSYNINAAHSWYGGEGDSYIIQGIIPIESINFSTTLRQNLVNPTHSYLLKKFWIRIKI